MLHTSGPRPLGEERVAVSRLLILGAPPESEGQWRSRASVYRAYVRAGAGRLHPVSRHTVRSLLAAVVLQAAQILASCALVLTVTQDMLFTLAELPPGPPAAQHRGQGAACTIQFGKPRLVLYSFQSPFGAPTTHLGPRPTGRQGPMLCRRVCEGACGR